MKTDFLRFYNTPRIFSIRDIMSENQSLIHTQ